MYRRWPSAYSVSNARELFPEPLKPVMTMRRCKGRSRLKFLRLLCRTPRIRMAADEFGSDIPVEKIGHGLAMSNAGATGLGKCFQIWLVVTESSQSEKHSIRVWLD